MKRAGYSIFLDDLAEQLEKILKKAKENDLCHLIEPLEETILKVKELNREREVECELRGECNSETCNLQMACSCNDWGPDTLGSDGKWICKLCGTNCYCDQIWGSCTHLPKKEASIKSLGKTKKKENIPVNKTGNENRTNKTGEKSEKDISVLYTTRLCNSIKKEENQDKILKKVSQSSKKENVEIKLISNEIRGQRSKQVVDHAKKRKCANCKCTDDEKGNKLKTEECRAASEKRKKLARLEKEQNEKVEVENRKVEIEIKKPPEIKVSQSTGNCNCFRKDTSTNVTAFAKKEKSGIVACKSSSVGLLSSWMDSKDQRCWDGLKALNDVPLFQAPKNEEKKVQQISKCAKKRSQNVPEKYASSRSDRGLQKSSSKLPPKCIELEKPESPLKCSELSKREPVQKCYELISKNSKKFMNCSEIADSLSVKTHDEFPKQSSTRPRRHKQKGEKYKFPGEDRQKEMHRAEGKILNQNFEESPCNYCNPATSTEQLCSCGCGYFLRGVPATSPCPCSNSLKTPHEKENTEFKNSVAKSRKHDCEGCCDWCNSSTSKK